MPRPRKGTLEFRKGRWWAKITLDSGGRERILLPEGIGRAKAAELAAKLSERAASKKLAKPRHASAPTSSSITVEAWGGMWTSGELFRHYGNINKLKAKRSARQDASRLKTHVNPVIGKRKVTAVKDTDVDAVFARLRDKPRTAEKVYLLLHRLFDLAIVPGRLRKVGDNPVTPYHRPGKGSEKLFAYLLPTEFLSLVGCRGVPLERRVLYTLAVYTGLRKSSLLSLSWGNLDLREGLISALVTKTGVPQLFQIEADLTGLLRRWRGVCGRGETDPVVVLARLRDAGGVTFRTDLRVAGVTRAVLFQESAVIQPIRFHDLRATFATWAHRDGRGLGWISDRTGHLTPSMIERYTRSARTLADLRMRPFPPLWNAIPELSQETSQPPGGG